MPQCIQSHQFDFISHITIIIAHFFVPFLFALYICGRRQNQLIVVDVEYSCQIIHSVFMVWSRTALSHSTWSSYFPTDYLWMVRRFVRMMCINAEATAWGWIRSSCDCLHWRGRWWWLALKRDVENRQFTFRHFSSGYTTHSQHTHMALAIVTMSNET